MTLLAVPCVGLLISALMFHETVNVSFGLGVALVWASVAPRALGEAPTTMTGFPRIA
jgi:hypothetical protein